MTRKVIFNGVMYESTEKQVIGFHGSKVKFNSFDPKLGIYWFSNKPEHAASQGEFVYKAKLTMNNPYKWREGDIEPEEPEFTRQLIEGGFDSCIAPSNIGDVDYIVYSVNQIQLLRLDASPLHVKNMDSIYMY